MRKSQEYAAVDWVNRHIDLVGCGRPGNRKPIRVQSDVEIVSLNFKLPADVIAGPGELERIAHDCDGDVCRGGVHGRNDDNAAVEGEAIGPEEISAQRGQG